MIDLLPYVHFQAHSNRFVFQNQIYHYHAGCHWSLLHMMLNSTIGRIWNRFKADSIVVRSGTRARHEERVYMWHHEASQFAAAWRLFQTSTNLRTSSQSSGKSRKHHHQKRKRQSLPKATSSLTRDPENATVQQQLTKVLDFLHNQETSINPTRAFNDFIRQVYEQPDLWAAIAALPEEKTLFIEVGSKIFLQCVTEQVDSLRSMMAIDPTQIPHDHQLTALENLMQNLVRLGNLTQFRTRFPKETAATVEKFASPSLIQELSAKLHSWATYLIEKLHWNPDQVLAPFRKNGLDV